MYCKRQADLMPVAYAGNPLLWTASRDSQQGVERTARRAHRIRVTPVSVPAPLKPPPPRLLAPCSSGYQHNMAFSLSSKSLGSATCARCVARQTPMPFGRVSRFRCPVRPALCTSLHDRRSQVQSRAVSRTRVVVQAAKVGLGFSPCMLPANDGTSSTHGAL